MNTADADQLADQIGRARAFAEEGWGISKRGNYVKRISNANGQFFLVVFRHGGGWKWLIIDEDEDTKQFSRRTFDTDEDAKCDVYDHISSPA